MMGGRTYLIESFALEKQSVIGDKGSAPGAVTLNPARLSEYESMQLLAEVLDHVIPLWFTVNEEIESNALLEAYDNLYFLLDEFLILRLGDFPLPKLSTSTADLFCLLEFKESRVWFRMHTEYEAYRE
jgi:hypothetical protein